jgi:hypothetical protein
MKYKQIENIVHLLVQKITIYKKLKNNVYQNVMKHNT